MWAAFSGLIGCYAPGERPSSDMPRMAAPPLDATATGMLAEKGKGFEKASASGPIQTVGYSEPVQEGDGNKDGAVIKNLKPSSEDDSPSPTIPEALTNYPIDLGGALALAGVENPTILLAQEAVRAGLAEQLQARVLLLPTLNAGMNYRLHAGNLLASSGIIRDVNSQSLYVGAGANTKAAESVSIPGIRIYSQVADAWFDPQIARNRVSTLSFDSQATQNTILLEVSTAYLSLVGAEARLQALRQSARELAKVVQLTVNFASTGQGRQADAERAQTEALLLQTQEQRAEEEVAVASAELARLLNMDPAIRFQVADSHVPLIQLVPPQEDLQTLVYLALDNRPEVRARMAEVAMNATRLRKERVRPLVPLLSVGFSAGDFGGGSNLVTPRFGNFDGRTDFDVLAVWTLQNLGVGNLAIQRERRAELNEAQAEQVRVIDLVGREVAEAQAQSLARRREVDVARARAKTAQEGFRLDLIRTRNIQGLPIEVLNNLRLLTAARLDLVRALIGYNEAQFRLFVALGQPPTLAAIPQ